MIMEVEPRKRRLVGTCTDQNPHNKHVQTTIIPTTVPPPGAFWRCGAAASVKKSGERTATSCIIRYELGSAQSRPCRID